MHTHRASWSLLLAACCCAIAQPAAADIPPPPGYVETCTTATQESLGGGPCELVDTFQGGVAPAADAAFRARGLEPRCTGGGATVGIAVYCDGAAGVAPTPTPAPAPAPAAASTPAPAPSGCAISGHGGRSGPGALIALALAGWLACRRRAPRAR